MAARDAVAAGRMTEGRRPGDPLLLRWGRAVQLLRWWLLSTAAVVVVIGVLWGSGVFGVLSSGGFDDPASESARAADQVAERLGRQDVDLVVLYSSLTSTADGPTFRDAVREAAARLRARPEVSEVATYYDGNAPAMVSRDRHATYATVTFRARDDDTKKAEYRAVAGDLAAAGLRTQVGGQVAFNATADTMTKRDVTRGEMLALPVLLVLLVLVFRGLVAASLPLLVGMLAILGALTTTRLISLVTDVSTFAVNTITLLGLGMAIDYSLLVVSRFREESARGWAPADAAARTMATAGRTVLVSAATVVLALASLLIFPQAFLRSMGLGGMAAVTVAVTGALTVLPALLIVLGRRVDAGRVPLPRRPGRPPAGEAFWSGLARRVLRRPVRYIAAVAVVLAVLATPLARVAFAGADERILPSGAEPRVVAERLAADFPGGVPAPIEVLVEDATDGQVAGLTARIRPLDGVTGVRSVASRSGTTLLAVTYADERTSDRAYDLVRAVRKLPMPSGMRMLVGGRPAEDVDLLDGLAARLPWMGVLMAAVTLVLLFLAFGSVLLPIKAVILSAVSIASSFGVVVWVFQQGHLSGPLGFTATGFLQPNIPIMLLAILFGLSTDYEVFLLSRMREAWDGERDPAGAIVAGLQRTGGIITAAAMLLVVVVAGFATGEVAFAKLIGIGMITAIVVDATLVRALLVPAVMRLFGRAAWWAPGPLARVYRRYGITEAAPAPQPVERADESVAVD